MSDAVQCRLGFSISSSGENRRITAEENLVVINFRSKNLSEELSDWRDGNPVAIAESCSRQVWYGHKDIFTDFSFEGVNVLEGSDAYAFLLKLLVGLDSDKKGETEIKGQFYSCWNAFKEQNPSTAKTLRPVLQHLKADSRAIQNGILSSYKLLEPMLIARDLSGYEEGSSVLLVGNVSRHGYLGGHTENLAKKINNNKARASKIYVTHPDPENADFIYNELLKLKNSNGKQIVTCPVEKIDFDDVSVAMEICEQTFVDIAMGEDIDSEKILISSWQSRENKGATLTHVRGDPTINARTNELWSSADLDNFISPEDIRDVMYTRRGHNNQLDEIAEEAFRFCAELRVAGKSVSRKRVSEFGANLS